MFDPKKRGLVLAIGVMVAAFILASPAVAQEEEAEVPTQQAETSAVADETPASTVAEETPEAQERGAPKIYRENTLIVIDGRADFRGAIKLVFEPKGGEPVLVTINVNERTKAKKITEEFVRQLEYSVDDRYKVKQAGDRKIRVKVKNKKSPVFALSIEEQKISGVSVMITNG